MVIIAKIPEMHKIRLFGLNADPEPVVITRVRSDDNLKAADVASNTSAVTSPASSPAPKKRVTRSTTKKAK